MRIFIRFLLPALVLASMASPSIAAKDPAKNAEPDKPMNDRDVSASDVATTPLSDLNLRKGEIPALLITAQDKPYDLTGISRCPQFAAAIGELDAVLGEDIDVAVAKNNRTSAGKVAQSVVGAFIPFRGVIREVSGANAQDRKVQTAIYAGSVRRAFLKGVGQQRGCRYPARSATAQIIAEQQALASGKPLPTPAAKKRKAKRRH